MLTTRAEAQLLKDVHYGDYSQPDMSPTGCVLRDGTILVASARLAGTPALGYGISEYATIWHLSASGSVIGSVDWVPPSEGAVDVALVALPGANALMVARVDVQTETGTTPSGYVLSLDCSGATPVVASMTTTSYTQQFTNADGVRWAYYCDATGQALVSGVNGVATYKNGAYQDQYKPPGSWNVWGWWPNPDDSTKVAFAVREYPAWEFYEVTLTGGGFDIRNVSSEHPYTEDNWLISVGNPYDPAGLIKVEGGTGGTDQALHVQRGGVDIAVAPAPVDGWWLNYGGPSTPISNTDFVTVVEYGESTSGAPDKYHPTVTEIDTSTTPPTLRQQALDWGGSLHNDGYSTQGGVSLSYGSFTLDARDGTMVLVGAYVNNFTDTSGTGSAQHYGVNAWIFDVNGGGVAPPPTGTPHVGVVTLIRPQFFGSSGLLKTRFVERDDIFDLAYFEGAITLPQPNVIQRELPGNGLFKGAVAVRKFTPFGAFRDFSHYENGWPDPAMALVTGEASGLSTFDVGTPSNMRRIWVDVAAPREYPTTTEPYAWPRAAFASVGVRVNGLQAAEYQYVDAAQIENKPLSRTGPTDYAPARSFNIAVRPDRLNYQKFPVGDANTLWAGWMCSGGDLSVPETGYIRATVNDATPSDMGTQVQQPPGSNIEVSGGRVYTFSVQARGSLPMRMRIMFFREFLDGGTARIGDPIDGKTIIPGRTFTALPPITAFVPAEAKYAYIDIGISGTGPRNVGDTFDFRYCLAEPGNAAKPFFDGNSGIDYLWEQGATPYGPYGARSYYYRDRTARAYLLGRLLAENCPIGIIPAVPQFAVFPDV